VAVRRRRKPSPSRTRGGVARCAGCFSFPRRLRYSHAVLGFLATILDRPPTVFPSALSHLRYSACRRLSFSLRFTGPRSPDRLPPRLASQTRCAQTVRGPKAGQGSRARYAGKTKLNGLADQKRPWSRRSQRLHDQWPCRAFSSHYPSSFGLSTCQASPTCPRARLFALLDARRARFAKRRPGNRAWRRAIRPDLPTNRSGKESRLQAE
jgi:hypothetical protein